MGQSYCDVAPGDPWHGPYHDNEYGFPIEAEDALFERLVLEINQAGLSWLTVLKKRAAFQRAYHGFKVDRIARYTDRDRVRLMGNPEIIRNRLKIDAAIENARRLCGLRTEFGSFSGWLAAHHPRDKAGWVREFRRSFVFVGGEIVGEFLMSTGYLPGAHRPGCPVYKRIARLRPPWTKI